MSNQPVINRDNINDNDDDITLTLKNLHDMLPIDTPSHFPDIITKCQRQDSFIRYCKNNNSDCNHAKLFKSALNKHKEYYSLWTSINKKK